jgi:hypothetical protein
MTVFVSASADFRHVLSHGYAVSLVRAKPPSALNSFQPPVITNVTTLLKRVHHFSMNYLLIYQIK